MLKLMNFSNHPYDLYRFSGDSNKIKKFLYKHDLQGLEIIQTSQWQKETVSSSLLHGLHMRFWPAWLDFYRNDKDELYRQFGDIEAYKQYYGGETWECILEYYRNEIKTACDMGVKYIVFHVSHVQLEHCYNYKFTYGDEEIIEAFIEMINKLFKDTSADFDLLLENQWWPGLTLLDKKLAFRLMDGINYPKKGFMLDIGHMMNTNTELKTEEEGVEYILRVLQNLEELSSNIKGIHLNSSVSGKYVKEKIKNWGGFNKSECFFDRYLKVFEHIAKIDNHIPFSHPSIKRVIEYINPKYLVYEFITNTFDELEQYVTLQNRVLKSLGE